MVGGENAFGHQLSSETFPCSRLGCNMSGLGMQLPHSYLCIHQHLSLSETVVSMSFPGNPQTLGFSGLPSAASRVARCSYVNPCFNAQFLIKLQGLSLLIVAMCTLISLNNNNNINNNNNK